jgi:hypothetical protein
MSHPLSIKGRLHSRFLRPLSRPRWRPCPTARCAFSRAITYAIAREKQGKLLRAVYTCVFCVCFSVRNGAAAAQLLPLLFVHDCARKAKEAVGQWHHRGRRNGRKKCDCRRPFRRRRHRGRDNGRKKRECRLPLSCSWWRLSPVLLKY